MVWRAEVLSEAKHLFLDAKGGVSTGKYASLNTNFNSQDSISNLQQNMQIIADKFNVKLSNLAAVEQGVSNKVIYLERPSFLEYEADAIVTTTPGILLLIKTADCAPVLLADMKNGVIGAAHAGWRGAYKGVVENTLQLMQQHGAELKNISAAIGPCLQQSSFEVKDDMRQIFLSQSLANDKYFSIQSQKEYKFDLSKYLWDKLHWLGIKTIENSLIDTYNEQNGYFSYRRNTHLGLISVARDYPTQMSCIML